MPSTGLSLKEVRLIDPILTTIAQGFIQPELIGNYLFPLAEVGMYGGQIIQFDKSAFQTYNSKRAPGANTKRIQTGYSGLPFSLALDALEHAVPIEHMNDAQMIGINWGEYAMGACMGGLTLNLEAEQAAIATDATKYATSNKITLSGSSQFSDPTSDPGPIIRAGKEAIRAATGMYPNLLAIGAQVLAKLQENTKVRDYVKYVSKDSVTVDLLAELWGFSKAVIGAAVVADATGTLSDVWGKNIIMAYVNPATLTGNRIGYNTAGQISRFSPSYGYTYVMRGMPMAKPRYYDNNADSWIYGAKFDRQPVVTGTSANLITSGYLISAAIA